MSRVTIRPLANGQQRGRTTRWEAPLRQGRSALRSRFLNSLHLNRFSQGWPMAGG